MNIIVAVNNLGYIGKNGNLMWKCKQDLQFFKRMTLNKKCLVGRKTFENLPILKDRTFLVVGTNYMSLEEALSHNPDFIIGGGEIYKQTMLICDRIYLSIINDNQEGDTKFEILPKFKGEIIKTYFNT